MNQASIFNDAVAAYIAKQPWYARRKDSITAVAGTVLQVANLAVAWTGNAPEWVSVLIAAVIGLAQLAVHAGTRGAITPSMGDRLTQAAATYQPQPDYPTPAPQLPVYDGPTTGGQ